MKHHEWLNQNCLRSFPLAEDTGRASLNMGWALPDFILCDASLVVQECDAGIYIQGSPSDFSVNYPVPGIALICKFKTADQAWWSIV